MAGFEIVPTMTVAHGRVVDSWDGGIAHAVTYPQNPLAVAGYWIRQGARRIHVEEAGSWGTLSAKAPLLWAYGRKVAIQVGGGIRDAITAHYLQVYGASTLVLRRCLTQPRALAQVLGGTAPQGLMLAINVEDMGDEALGYALTGAHHAGVRDVLLTGPWYAPAVFVYQLDAIRTLQDKGFRVWVAGGLRHLETVHALKELGASGVMVGRALRSGILDWDTLQRMAG